MILLVESPCSLLSMAAASAAPQPLPASPDHMSMMAGDMEDEEEQQEWGPDSVGVDTEPVRSALLGCAGNIFFFWVSCTHPADDLFLSSVLQFNLPACKQQQLTLTDSYITHSCCGCQHSCKGIRHETHSSCFGEPTTSSWEACA